MSTESKLSKTTILLHWTTALLFLFVLITGITFEPFDTKKFLMDYHKSVGTIVLFVATIRILWRFKEGAIKPLNTTPAWQNKAATAIHHLLLLITILMPLSGAIMSIAGGRGLNIFGIPLVPSIEKIPSISGIASTVHTFSVNIVILIILAHILAALKHHFINKNRTLKRMLGK